MGKDNIDLITLNNIDKINALMFNINMDDRTPLNVLENYIKKWNLEINDKKTKCITFSKSKHKEKHQFIINSQKLENTNEYKYLGIIINKKGLLAPA